MFKQVFLIMSFLMPALLFGQGTGNDEKLIKQISVSVNSESVSIPFTRYFPIHPGAEIGLTLKETEREKSISRWNLGLGGYYHQRTETAFYLKGEYQFQYALHPNLGIDLMGGLGYMHTFYPADIYSQNPETGDYSVASQLGRPHLIGEASIGLTFTNDSPFEPFIRQSFMVETPFANGIPFAPHSFLKIGLNIKL